MIFVNKAWNGTGDIEILNQFKNIAVSGGRKISETGRYLAYQTVQKIGEAGINIVYGLAIGCDTEAIRGALNVGARCVVILPCGLERVVPKANRDLAEEGSGTMHAVDFAVRQYKRLACYSYKMTELSSGNKYLESTGKAQIISNQTDVENYIGKIMEEKSSLLKHPANVILIPESIFFAFAMSKADVSHLYLNSFALCDLGCICIGLSKKTFQKIHAFQISIKKAGVFCRRNSCE